MPPVSAIATPKSSAAATSTNMPTRAFSRVPSIRSPGPFFHVHPQMVYATVVTVRIRHTVEKLAHSRVIALLKDARGFVGNDMAFVHNHDAVGNQKGAGQLVGHDDHGNVVRRFEIQNQIVDA